MRRSQRAMLREHFERRRSITAQQALKLYGIARLAARIHEMRECECSDQVALRGRITRFLRTGERAEPDSP